MKTVTTFLLFAGMVLSKSNGLAQTVTLTTAPSQCKATGSLTVQLTPSPGSPQNQYTVMISGTDIYGQPYAAGPTNTLVINAMPAGTYSVTTTDAAAGFTNTQSVTVNGNYQAPGLLTIQSYTNQSVDCSGNTTRGSVTLSQPSAGLAPYSYAIGNNAATLSWQSSPVFGSLTPGTYSIWARDYCGDVRTTSVTINSYTASTNVLNTAYAILTDIPCSTPDSFAFTYQGQLYLSSYHLEIRAGGCSGPVLFNYPLTTANQLYHVINMPTIAGACYQLTGVNTCNGNTETRTLTPPTGFFYATIQGGGLADCAGNYTYTYSTTNMSYPITIDFYNQHFTSLINSITANTNYGSFFWNQPAGTYNAIFTDACGQKDTATFSNTNTLSSFFVYVNAKGPVGCEIGKGYADLLPFGTAPFTINMLTKPVSSNPVIKLTSGNIEYYNLIPGAYSVEVIDACGRKDTADFTILSTDVTNFTNGVLDSVSRVCGATNATVYYSITGNFSYMQPTDLQISLVNTATGFSINSFGAYSWTNNTVQRVFNNVPPGNYKVKFNWGPSQVPAATCFQPSWDTVHISGATVPSLTPSEAFTCQTGSNGIIVANATGGYPPYQYQMRLSGSPAWGPLQTSNLFTISSASIGTVYELQAVDKCGNTSVYQVTMLGGPVPRTLSPLPDTACIGDAVSINLVNSLPTATYQWKNSANVILPATGTSLNFPSVTLSDEDTYTLTTSISGCITLVANSMLHVVNCNNSLPVSVISFSGQRDDDHISLRWKTGVEESIAGYEVQRSTDGSSFSSMDYVIATGKNNYTITDYTASGKVYYRLKVMSLDNTYFYSTIISINGKPATSAYGQVYPNPFKDKFNISFTAQDHGTADISLWTITGSQVKQTSVICNKGINEVFVDGLNALPAGLYIVRIKNGAGVNNIKVQKQ